MRYDGQSKNLAALEQWPQHLVHLLPICPEVGAGMTVPRPPVQLVASDNLSTPRARGRDDHDLDVTAALQQFAHNSAQALAREPALCGYIWKSRSPSCGFESTPLFDMNGTQIDTTSGIQAHTIHSALPWLITAEETQLATSQHIAQFLLLCRLIFDARWASSNRAAYPHNHSPSLHRWHQHYRFLQDILSTADHNALENAAADGDWDNYLIALQSSCRRVEAERLLDLFRH